MTTEQVILCNCFYLLELVAAAYFTRASGRRIAGAVAGGAVIGLVFPGVIAFVEAMGWWRVPMQWTPFYLSMFYLDFVLACAPVYLVTWRVARRFGWRGMAVLLATVAVIGPVRDYQVVVMFPEWIVFSPCVAPVLGVAAVYVGTVVLGQAVMRVVAGPAGSDPLVRQPKTATETAITG